jgi:hypothetical protein
VLTGGLGGVSDRGGGRTDRAGPAPGDTGADRRARDAGCACAKRYPRSGSCDHDRTGGGIITGRDERLRAALLLSAAVRSPELRHARARVAPRGRRDWAERENATMNSMAGKRPRIREQRRENGGEKASGGPEEL